MKMNRNIWQLVIFCRYVDFQAPVNCLGGIIPYTSSTQQLDTQIWPTMKTTTLLNLSVGSAVVILFFTGYYVR